MKSMLMMAAIAIFMIACKNEKKEPASPEKKESEQPAASSITFPYKANYSSQFNDKVSDEDVLLVLNSYKYWENNDMKALAGTLADTVSFQSWSAFTYDGPKAGLIDRWGKTRDSLSSVSISVDAWTKDHSVDKNEDFVLVWYKEIDTYKMGAVDSANFADINMIKNGKIVWYSQYRQKLPTKAK
jgi:ketosteroid isomerase-like protein